LQQSNRAHPESSRPGRAYHHDQLGSTRAITNASGAVVATYAFAPYGNAVASSGTLKNPFLFDGQYHDAKSGLYYLRARYYDPTTAQFLTVDPDVTSTRSPYAYVEGHPLNGADPSGQWCGLWGDNACYIPLPGGMCIANGNRQCSNGDTGINNLYDNLSDPNPPPFIGFVRGVSPATAFTSDYLLQKAHHCVPLTNWPFDALGLVPGLDVAGGAERLAAKEALSSGGTLTAVQLHNLSLWLGHSVSGQTINQIHQTARVRGHQPRFAA